MSGSEDGKPFYETERDLTDEEQRKFEPDADFDSSQPEGAGKSIESAREISFSDQIEEGLRDRAETLQTTENDPDIPDKFEDDVYRNEARAFQALKASFLRGLGAAQSTRGVESNIRWSYARVDDFSKTVKAGEPDDAEFKSDNDLLPDGHPLASREETGELDDQPFVEGLPDEDMQDKIEREVFGSR
jgi:hypothetical protein